MNTAIGAVASVRKTIDVDATLDRAFNVFTKASTCGGRLKQASGVREHR